MGDVFTTNELKILKYMPGQIKSRDYLKKVDKVLKNMSSYERARNQKFILRKRKEFIKNNSLSKEEMNFFLNNYRNFQKNQFIEEIRNKVNENKSQENFNIFVEVIKAIKKLNEEFNDYIENLQRNEKEEKEIKNESEEEIDNGGFSGDDGVEYNDDGYPLVDNTEVYESEDKEKDGNFKKSLDEYYKKKKKMREKNVVVQHAKIGQDVGEMS